MNKQTLSVSNLDLLFLMDYVNHLMYLLWQRELNKHNVPVRQYKVLYRIQALGSKATLNTIAEKVERKVDVISRQTVSMEKDGLIQRIKDNPKSRLLRIELTEKGLDKLKICNDSKTIDMILSILTDEERQQMYSVLKKIVIRAERHKVRN